MSQIEKLREFIDISVKSKSNHKFFEIEIPSDTCIKIEKILGINLNSYRFVIKEEYIRHVKNRHPNDMDLLLELPNIINNFSKVEKSIIKNTQTGKPEVNLVFYKIVNCDKIEMVAIRIFKKKILSLKTVYRKEL